MFHNHIDTESHLTVRYLHISRLNFSQNKYLENKPFLLFPQPVECKWAVFERHSQQRLLLPTLEAAHHRPAMFPPKMNPTSTLQSRGDVGPRVWLEKPSNIAPVDCVKLILWKDHYVPTQRTPLIPGLNALGPQHRIQPQGPVSTPGGGKVGRQAFQHLSEDRVSRGEGHGSRGHPVNGGPTRWR